MLVRALAFERKKEKRILGMKMGEILNGEDAESERDDLMMQLLHYYY